MKKYQSLYLAGVISEDVYYQIQDLDQNGMLTEGILKDLMRAGVLGAGLLGAGAAVQPLINKAPIVSQQQINDPDSYVNAAINKIKSGVESQSVEDGGNVQIDSIKITGKDKSGRIFVKVIGKADNVEPSSLSKAAAVALQQIMGSPLSVHASWPARNDGFYTDDTPTSASGSFRFRDVPKEPTPFYANIIIEPFRNKAV